MRAKDVMSQGVMSVTADATIFEAAELLTKCRVSAMPVVDERGRMIGIISEADLIRRAEIEAAGPSSGFLRQLADDMGAAAAYVHANSHRVVDVMTKDVISVDQDAPLGEIAELMVRRGIKRVPVRSGQSIVGIVSRIDLLRALMPRVPASEASSIEDGSSRSSDDQLRLDVERAVKRQSWSVATNVDVVVLDGIVHFWGRVASDAVARAHVIAAGKVPGVQGIENHLHVVPPVPR